MLVSASHPFCVYTHSIDGVVFYVGKGDAMRAFSTRCRNQSWIDKTTGQDYDVQIVSRHATSREAIEAERALIKHLKPECNFINNGLKRPEAHKADLSAARKGIPRKPEDAASAKAGWHRAIARGTFKRLKLKPIICIETGVRYNGLRCAERDLGIDNKSIRNVLSGKYKRAGGYTFRYAED